MNIQKSTSHEAVVEDYDRLWARWLDGNDLDEVVAHHKESRRPFLDLLSRFLHELDAGSRVMELGCGTAVDLNILSGRFPGLVFLASDISVEALKVAQVTAGKMDAACSGFAADIRRLPFVTGTIDCIFTQGVMEHFREPMPFFREQADMVRPGGYLVVNVPQKYTGYTLHKHRRMKKGTWELGWECEFSARELLRIGRTLGLAPLQVCGYNYWRSWQEPMFVLRDLVDKLYRTLRLPEKGLPGLPKRLYDRVWSFLEQRWGHLFMQNVVVVFRRPAADGGGE